MKSFVWRAPPPPRAQFPANPARRVVVYRRSLRTACRWPVLARSGRTRRFRLLPTRQFWGGIYRARTAPPAPTHLLNGWQRKCATSVHRPSDLALPRSDPRGLARDTAIVVDSAVGGVRLHRPTRWQLLRSRRRWRSRCGRADFDVADSRRRFGLALGAEVVPTCVASVANFEWRRCAVWVWVACGE